MSVTEKGRKGRNSKRKERKTYMVMEQRAKFLGAFLTFHTRQTSGFPFVPYRKRF